MVQLINPEDKMVILSTDKKYEGNPYSGDLNFEIEKSTELKEDQCVQIITPEMGFTNKIGVLIVELKRE